MSHSGYQEVIQGLFIGSRFSLHVNSLKQDKITHLLSVDGYKEFPSGFTTKSLEIIDDQSENILQHFKECIEFIGNNRTLVFCTAGRSRSVTIVAAYIMQVYNKSSDEALDLIQNVRRINPNPGFLDQLKTWEVQKCELCNLEKKTEWFFENENFVCLRCEQCDLPMIVFKKHTMIVSDALKTEMKEAISSVANKTLGEKWFLDTKQRTYSAHMHWHARPMLFKI